MKTKTARESLRSRYYYLENEVTSYNTTGRTNQSHRSKSPSKMNSRGVFSSLVDIGITRNHCNLLHYHIPTRLIPTCTISFLYSKQLNKV